MQEETQLSEASGNTEKPQSLKLDEGFQVLVGASGPPPGRRRPRPRTPGRWLKGLTPRRREEAADKHVRHCRQSERCSSASDLRSRRSGAEWRVEEKQDLKTMRISPNCWKTPTHRSGRPEGVSSRISENEPPAPHVTVKLCRSAGVHEVTSSLIQAQVS